MPVALGTLGWFYAVVAVVLGARFIWLAILLRRTPEDRGAARRMFLYSLLYLALLFAAMGIDSLLLGGAALEHGDHARGSSRIETGVTAVSSPKSGSRLE